MKYRPLGKTDLKISEIGFGGWPIGGGTKEVPAYGSFDDKESQKALWHAYELGINFFDTANVYGCGHSEELIGTALRSVRHKVILATKGGYADDHSCQNFSPPHLRKNLEKSLLRLRTDYVDLYQLHSPDMKIFVESDIIATLQTFVKEGRVRALGISVRHPDDALVVTQKKYGFHAIQANFSMVDQRILDNGLMNICQKEEIGLIARTPLCYGFLSGKYSEKNQFDESDHRSAWSEEQRKKWAGSISLFLDVANHKREQTKAQLALRFCLSYTAISTIIPGIRTKGQADENALASSLGPLTEQEREKMEQIHFENRFFLGRK